MSTRIPTLGWDQRIALCQNPVTLDGKPARVQGYGLPFATVWAKGSDEGVSFSWVTVQLVIARGGRFSS